MGQEASIIHNPEAHVSVVRHFLLWVESSRAMSLLKSERTYDNDEQLPGLLKRFRDAYEHAIRAYQDVNSRTCTIQENRNAYFAVKEADDIAIQIDQRYQVYLSQQVNCILYDR